jgi:BirA family biotin operon repressor/biotin-[acetyl-CoA-carboxylase] ligase
MIKDEMSERVITNGLKSRLIGRRVIYFPSLASTMGVAKDEAERGATEGTVIISDEQIAGRGRFSREWFSPKGSISLSIILRPAFASLPYIIMLSAVAMSAAIENITGLNTQLKWPNDVLVRGSKVCGLLMESSLKGSHIKYAIIGIGANVNMKMVDYPEIASTATSLSDELGAVVSRLALVRRLLSELDRLYGLLPDGEDIYEEWRQRMVMLGKMVQVISGDNIYNGVAEDVAKDGSLLLRHDDGSSSHILAGDVSTSELGADHIS